MKGKQYAEKLYPGQKTWIHIATTAYNKGYLEGVRAQQEKGENYQELDELRAYKREMEAIMNDPDRIGELIAGL